MLSVRAVDRESDWKAFQQVPRTVYRNDPHWIPEIATDLEPLLVHPTAGWRQRADTQAFVAWKGTIPVGRIVVIEDHRQNRRNEESVAFFGFYEAIADDDVAFGLFDAAAGWARQRSLTELRGPVNPSMEYGAGLLVGADGRSPLIGMPYNPMYYAEQVGRWGMTKVKELHSYRALGAPSSWLASDRAVLDRGRRRAKVRFRAIRLDRFEQEVESVRQLYNAAFDGFWGFTPLDGDEFLQLANGFRPILDPELAVFAEIDGRPIGFLMAIPDVNQALARAARFRNGVIRNLVTLWHWKGPRRRKVISHVRVDMLMLEPDYIGTGIAFLLLAELVDRIRNRGYASLEGAPVLEGADWIRPLRGMVEVDRVYRVYGRSISRASRT